MALLQLRTRANLINDLIQYKRGLARIFHPHLNFEIMKSFLRLSQQIRLPLQLVNFLHDIGLLKRKNERKFQKSFLQFICIVIFTTRKCVLDRRLQPHITIKYVSDGPGKKKSFKPYWTLAYSNKPYPVIFPTALLTAGYPTNTMREGGRRRWRRLQSKRPEA